MPRKGSVPKRDVLPDHKYGSKVVTKLVNQVMEDGKKSVAQNIVYGAFDIIEKKLGVEAIDYFNQALENLKPLLETKLQTYTKLPLGQKLHLYHTNTFLHSHYRFARSQKS